MNLRPALPLALALLATTACSSGDCFDPSTPGCVVASAQQRDTSPPVSAEQLGALVAGNTAFAASLYQRLAAEPGNLVSSPLSASSALAMTYAGARGETEAQMAKALGFSLPQEELHPAFDALDLALRSRAEEGVELNLVNAVWAQLGRSFEAPYLDVLQRSYGAGVRIVDFAREPGSSREIINGWVADETEDRIPELFPAGVIDGDTRLVLANAVYLRAPWAAPFEAADTAPRSFVKRDGAIVQVETMSADRKAGYAEGGGWAALELGYAGEALSMILILPADLDAFEASLTGERLSEIQGALFEHQVKMTIPRFKLASKLDLAARLGELGMVDAFTDAADFSGIDGTRELRVGAVVQQAFIEVDEGGTEAAAATGVEIETKSAVPAAEIHFDRPYLFLIVDRATGAILFLGRVEEP